jgi:hypothetical protein
MLISTRYNLHFYYLNSDTGVAGDRSGMIAVDGGFIYVCTADWASPGSANIWTRTALTAGAW